MSERGLVLALQRLHDDPGFIDLVRQDSESTLGIYDLDETECQTLITAINNDDGDAVYQLAKQAGINWTADHIEGVGALDDREVSVEQQGRPGIQGPGALSGDGYEGVMPERPAGT